MDNDDKRHNHGLIVWDGDGHRVNHLSFRLRFGERAISNAVVVVYDVTNPSSFDEAKHHIEEYWRNPFNSYDVVGLVGSKADLWMHRKIKYEVLSCYNYKQFYCHASKM